MSSNFDLTGVVVGSEQHYRLLSSLFDCISEIAKNKTPEEYKKMCDDLKEQFNCDIDTILKNRNAEL